MPELLEDNPTPMKRVAQLASKLAAIDPSATDTVKALFAVFAEVQDHFRRPEPIETAPHEAGASIFLFCPVQRGWQVGQWKDENGPAWVATIDPSITLIPTHWMRPAGPPS